MQQAIRSSRTIGRATGASCSTPSVDPRTHADLWVLPLAGDGTPSGTATPFANTEFSEEQGRFSPDARWIAYASDESGRSEIYIQPFPAPPNGGSKIPISRDGGSQPRWRRDGKELFYFSPDGKLMAADVTEGPTFKASVPRTLFQVPVAQIGHNEGGRAGFRLGRRSRWQAVPY